LTSDFDHVLSTLPSELLRRAGILSDPSWIDCSDHTPIWAGYRLPRRHPPIRPIWEQTERRLRVVIKKTESPQAMVQAFLYQATPTAVPQEFVEAIAQAFQQSPAARALKADLTISLETLFSYALSFGGSSAPGKSGVSYRLFKVAPLSVQEEIFEHLQELWLHPLLLTSGSGSC
jgi:hypothetical protein